VLHAIKNIALLFQSLEVASVVCDISWDQRSRH
jgi:hypothetical protein